MFFAAILVNDLCQKYWQSLIVHYRLSAFRSRKRKNRHAVNKLLIFCVLGELEIFIYMVLKDGASQQEWIWSHVHILWYFFLKIFLIKWLSKCIAMYVIVWNVYFFLFQGFYNAVIRVQVSFLLLLQSLLLLTNFQQKCIFPLRI